MRRAVLALLALLAAAPARPQTAPREPPTQAARVIRTYPHDRGAYTEGLFIDRGELWESTGEAGRSSVRRVDLATGRVLQRAAIAPPLFGEGIVPWRDTILSLTWRDGVGFRWRRRDLALAGRFAYAGEGWALTSDGRELIMSDGTPMLRFIDGDDFRVTHTLTVTAPDSTGKAQPLRMLNELEYVDGEILANIWMTDRIARIDPADGHVIGWIDLSALHRRAGTYGADQVANGIAWDRVHRRLYVTGKEWPLLFEIAPPKG